jgi:hypothetical protein
MGIKSCNNHPTRTAVMHCSQCHKPICEKCVQNGRFCSQPCNEKFSKFYSSFKGGGQKTSKLMRVVSTVVSLALLAGGVYVLLKFLGVQLPGR